MRKASFFKLDEGGGFAPVSGEECILSNELTWIRADVKSIKSILKKIQGAPALVTEVLSAKETRPRAFAYNDTLLASFRGVNPSKNSEPEDMVSVRLWVTKRRIITVQCRALGAIDEIEKTLRDGVGPKSPAEFLEALLCSMSDKSAEVVSSLGDSLDAIEDSVIQTPSQSQRRDLSVMRRRAILLRRYLIPQREAISRIAVDKLSWISDVGLMHFRETADANTRLLEDLDAERERATVIHEELFSLAQEDMNKKMYWLTIVAIIFMPLGFITGLLGVNVGGIPGTNWHYGFLVVCSLLCLLFVFQILYLKIKRWI